MIRLAAVGDVHFGADSAGTLHPHLQRLPDEADLLLLAGDLTRVGHPSEAAVLVEELESVPLPILAVLGNHDYHSGQEHAIAELLEDAGMQVLDGESAVIDVGGTRVGVAGVKGFGGGFVGASAADFGEVLMKTFVGHTREVSERLEACLNGLDVDVRLALLHYSPTETTLEGERLEIYPFLGSYLLGEAVDRAGADLVIHGHAHSGTEKGGTPGGVPVRNVAQPVIKRAYNVYCFDAPELASAAPAGDGSGAAPRSSVR